MGTTWSRNGKLAPHVNNGAVGRSRTGREHRPTEVNITETEAIKILYKWHGPRAYQKIFRDSQMFKRTRGLGPLIEDTCPFSARGLSHGESPGDIL